MIRRAMLRQPGAVHDVAVDLWERLAVKLISIIGDGGFQSLYARSIHLTSIHFSWLARSVQSSAADSRFVGLKASLERRESAEASEASIALLITFIDILTLLIGDSLTASILRSAWGDDALDIAEKEVR